MRATIVNYLFREKFNFPLTIFNHREFFIYLDDAIEIRMFINSVKIKMEKL